MDLLVRVLVELVVIIVPSTSVTLPSGIVRVLVVEVEIPERSKPNFFEVTLESCNTGAVRLGAVRVLFVSV